MMTGFTDLNFIIGLDAVMNSAVMMLMTPYYKDDVYYKRACYLCILCCARSTLSYKHKEEENSKNEDRDDNETTVVTQTYTHTNSTELQASTNTAVSATSMDTMDQLQKTAKDLNVNNVNADDDNYNQLEASSEPNQVDNDDNI